MWIGTGNGAVSVWQQGTLAPTAAQPGGHAVRAFANLAHGPWWATAGDGVLFSNDGGARCVARNCRLANAGDTRTGGPDRQDIVRQL
ncbi:MAG: hypothetical protein IPL52_11170 [Flavobacteriales bacterium]|nr:hypothetical protein [Flavobacteriales bacterium]